MIIDYEIVLF